MLKRLVSIALVLMFALSVVVMGVSASNHLDKDFSFDFTAWERDTEWRWKENTTSAYMKCTNTGATYWGKVYEAYYGNSTTMWQYDRSHGYEYSFNSGTVRFMLNWVREETNVPYYADPRAFIKGRSGPIIYTAVGVWSPDSV